jgi:hypothetical protein
MTTHRFERAVYEGIAVVGAQCVRCEQIVLFMNAEIPEDIREQECPAKHEDVNQAAFRTMREATERD